MSRSKYFFDEQLKEVGDKDFYPYTPSARVSLSRWVKKTGNKAVGHKRYIDGQFVLEIELLALKDNEAPF